MSPPTRPRVGIVTCLTIPEPDPDQGLLLERLDTAGLNGELLPWDDTSADPEMYNLCVLRSCWNYYLDPEGFRRWIDRAERATRVLNPPPVLRWNVHKGYLRELERAGVPVVPTAWVERGSALSLEALCAERGWQELVLKPAVSASSHGTRRFGAGEGAAAQAFLESSARGSDVLVQEYQPSVEDPGERVLVWIDGAWSHAVRKHSRFAGEDEGVSDALEITADERELGERALAASPGAGAGLLYARVDVLADREGQLRVSELELLEPSLYLAQHPPALERLVAAIAREVARGRS